MAFKTGNKLSGSRKGSPNKLSLSVALLLADKNYSPAEKLIEASLIAITRFTEELELVQEGKLSPMESKAVQYLKIFYEANKELASYVYQKPKNDDESTITLIGTPNIDQINRTQKALDVLRSRAILDKDGSSVG